MSTGKGSFYNRSIRRTVATTCMLALTGLSAAASAQDGPESPGIALNRFTPAPVGDRMFGVQSPFIAGDMTPHASLLFDYARNPLVLKKLDGEAIGAIVSDQMFAHLNATFAFQRRVALSMSLPVALYQAGTSPAGGGLSFPSPSSAEIGDLRVGARVALVGDYWDPFQLAIGGYVWLPTADDGEGSFVGEGARALPQIIAGGLVKDRLVWSFDLGADFRRSVFYGGANGVGSGTAIRTGAGVGILLADGNLQIGPEVTAAFTVADQPTDDVPFGRQTNLEAMLDARYRFMENFEAGVGVGAGLSSGLGTPQMRVVGMLAYSPKVKKPEPPPPPDADKDGIIDAQDACKDVKGVPNADPTKNGCPPDTDGDGIIDEKDACVSVVGVENADATKNGCPPDADGDGIIDAQDACKDVKGVQNADPAKNGCPPDTDEDGIIDAEDACIDIKGLKTSDPATNGCPGDTDTDTIRDDKDACPNEKGKPDPDPTKNGCPQAVRVTETEVIILQQVQFDTAKATIKKVSDPLLDEVAGVLKEHPEIVEIEVQGHTDNKGAAFINKKLSQDRAESVKKALVARGVGAERLFPKGFGPDKPIGDNKTEEGRQQNRRVQFVILKKLKKGEVPPPPAAAADPAKPAEPAKPGDKPAAPAPAKPPAPAKAPAPAKIPAPAKAPAAPAKAPAAPAKAPAKAPAAPAKAPTPAKAPAPKK